MVNWLIFFPTNDQKTKKNGKIEYARWNHWRTNIDYFPNFQGFFLFSWVIFGKLYQITQYFQGIQIQILLNLIMGFGSCKWFLNMNNSSIVVSKVVNFEKDYDRGIKKERKFDGKKIKMIITHIQKTFTINFFGIWVF